ncbi:MAG: hypothetical protein AAGI03_00690 [Pseudomonadota bacterium]
MDPRDGVVNDFTEHLFGVLFTQPKDLSDTGADAEITAAANAIKSMLPRDRLKAKAITDAAGAALKEDAASRTWPSIPRIKAAITTAKASEGDRTKHKPQPINSERMQLVKLREDAHVSLMYGAKAWPRDLGADADLIASNLIAIGRWTETELRAAGWTGAVLPLIEPERY